MKARVPLLVAAAVTTSLLGGCFSSNMDCDTAKNTAFVKYRLRAAMNTINDLLPIKSKAHVVSVSQISENSKGMRTCSAKIFVKWDEGGTKIYSLRYYVKNSTDPNVPYVIQLGADSLYDFGRSIGFDTFAIKKKRAQKQLAQKARAAGYSVGDYKQMTDAMTDIKKLQSRLPDELLALKDAKAAANIAKKAYNAFEVKFLSGHNIGIGNSVVKIEKVAFVPSAGVFASPSIRITIKNLSDKLISKIIFRAELYLNGSTTPIIDTGNGNGITAYLVHALHPGATYTTNIDLGFMLDDDWAMPDIGAAKTRQLVLITKEIQNGADQDIGEPAKSPLAINAGAQARLRAINSKVESDQKRLADDNAVVARIKSHTRGKTLSEDRRG